MTDVPVDTAVAAQTPAVEGLTEAEEEELRAELAKVLSLRHLSGGDCEFRLMRGHNAVCALQKLPWEVIPRVPQKLLFAATFCVPGALCTVRRVSTWEQLL